MNEFSRGIEFNLLHASLTVVLLYIFYTQYAVLVAILVVL